MLVKVKKRILNIPSNINLSFEKKICIIENKVTKTSCKIELPFFLDYIFLDVVNIEFKIIENYKSFQASKMMFYTFVSKLKHLIKGISELYRGVVNVQGLGYSVAITKLSNGKYNLFFRFGFKDKYNYIMPDNIIIENYEVANTKIILFCSSLELLKQVQIQIQRLRYPKAFKLQGIYLNDTYPKIKKFVK